MMGFLRKCFRFASGLVLFLLYRRAVDFQELLKGKRVAIVGAADSAFHTGIGPYIDGFDVVIRINKAPGVIAQGKWKNDIGSKTDILLHSFFENEKSGGGLLDIRLFDSLGIKWIVNPISDFGGYRVTFNFYKRYLLARTVYTFPKRTYARIRNKLGGFKPTIGFCALHAAVESDFQELYLTGFTFFRTAFGEGYRNEIKEATSARQYIKNAGLHDPDREFAEFRKLLEQNKQKAIICDQALKQIIANEA